MKRLFTLIFALVVCLPLCSCFYYPEQYPEQNPEQKITCPNCSKRIANDASFCEHCGVALQEEQSTIPFEPLSFSGTGHKTFRDINIPAGNYVLIGNATITGGSYAFSSFDVTIFYPNGNEAAYWIDSVSYEKTTVEKMAPFTGPISGGYLEIEAEDEASWTITIEEVN